MAQFGISMFPTDTTISPIDLAKAAEERGFDHLFFPEHTHIPVSRKTPFPGGGDLPEWYWRSHDPFVALSAAAAVTENLIVGTENRIFGTDFFSTAYNMFGPENCILFSVPDILYFG